jgi:hypothetical protein
MVDRANFRTIIARLIGFSNDAQTSGDRALAGSERSAAKQYFQMLEDEFGEQ